MPDEVVFRPDLYRGTADDYERFRVGYPATLIADLLARTGPSGRGRVLDLACGTGQITFAVLDRFAEAWAVDQEPDMVDAVAARAARSGTGQVHPIVSAAEELGAPAASFELVATGNAFHRLRRDTVAALAHRWLVPGGHLALLWGRSPWTGDEPWQRAMAAVLDIWQERAGVVDRAPAGWERDRERRPDATVLGDAGFEPLGSWPFATRHRWTVEELVGFTYSTSFLSRAALGRLAAPFEADLRDALSPYACDDGLAETIDFAYELARRP